MFSCHLFLSRFKWLLLLKASNNQILSSHNLLSSWFGNYMKKCFKSTDRILVWEGGVQVYNCNISILENCNGLNIIHLKLFFTTYRILIQQFFIDISNEIEICNKIFRNVSSNIYSLTLPKRPISKINLCYCFFNQWDSLNFWRGLVKFQKCK